MPEEKRRRFIDLILAETTRSEDMVRRLVQLAAIESRTDLATRETFDLAALVREEAAELDPAAGCGRSRWFCQVFRIPPSSPATRS